MFVVLYRWRLREGEGPRFREAWRTMTEAIRSRHGSLGSRLHLAEDGTWIAYAGWPNRAAWEAAQASGSAAPEAGATMAGCIVERLPPVCMAIADDLLQGSADGT